MDAGVDAYFGVSIVVAVDILTYVWNVFYS